MHYVRASSNVDDDVLDGYCSSCSDAVSVISDVNKLLYVISAV